MSVQTSEIFNVDRARETSNYIEQTNKDIAKEKSKLQPLCQEGEILLENDQNDFQERVPLKAKLSKETDETREKFEKTKKEYSAIDQSLINQIFSGAQNCMTGCARCTKSLCCDLLIISITSAGTVGAAMLKTNSTAILLLAGAGGASVGITLLMLYKKIKNCCASCCSPKDYKDLESNIISK